MSAYYNEIDKNAAEWIRELIKAGAISDGEVDERSIEDVLPADLNGFDRCHFFAGIGAWDYALNLAGWEGKVWTGSCPCQPFSTAGKRSGFTDERHLWPAWFHLIEVCRPDTIFGEQVASKDGLAWLDLVSADVEGVGYTIGTVDLPVAGVGAPHKRQRFFFGVGLADANSNEPRGRHREADGAREGSRLRHSFDAADGDGIMRLASAKRIGRRGRRDGSAIGSRDGIQPESEIAGRSNLDGVAQGNTVSKGSQGSGAEGVLPRRGTPNGHSGPTSRVDSFGVALGDTYRRRREQCYSHEREVQISGSGRSDSRGVCQADATSIRCWQRAGGQIEEGLQPRPDEVGILSGGFEGRGFTNGFWDGANWVYCADPDGPKWRPAKPGTFPLADGVPGRVALLRGAGNAISPWAAKAFIESYCEVMK